MVLKYWIKKKLLGFYCLHPTFPDAPMSSDHKASDGLVISDERLGLNQAYERRGLSISLPLAVWPYQNT